MRLRTQAVMVLALACSASPLGAQRAIDESRPAAADGTVEIRNLAGYVRVTGWDRSEVAVTGTLGRGAERLEMSGGGSNTRIEVVLPRGRNQRVEGSQLEVRVPSSSRLRVETVSADIEAHGVRGAMDLESVSGEISVGTPGRDVRAESVSGVIDITGPVEDVRAASVSGRVRVRGARGRAEAETVSGTVQVTDSDITQGTFKAVSGTVRYEGALSPRGSFTFESFSGTVDLLLPGDVDAAFDVSTFSGGISTDFPVELRTGRHTPEREARFTIGSGSARVTAKSFSGNVRIRRR